MPLGFEETNRRMASHKNPTTITTSTYYEVNCSKEQKLQQKKIGARRKERKAPAEWVSELSEFCVIFV